MAEEQLISINFPFLSLPLPPPSIDKKFHCNCRKFHLVTSRKNHLEFHEKANDPNGREVIDWHFSLRKGSDARNFVQFLFQEQPRERDERFNVMVNEAEFYDVGFNGNNC